MNANNTPLRRLRKAKNLSLETVAKAIGSDNGNLSRIERGIQKSLDLTVKLVDYFNNEITVAEILYPERYPERPTRRKTDKAPQAAPG